MRCIVVIVTMLSMQELEALGMSYSLIIKTGWERPNHINKIALDLNNRETYVDFSITSKWQPWGCVYKLNYRLIDCVCCCLWYGFRGQEELETIMLNMENDRESTELHPVAEA